MRQYHRNVFFYYRGPTSRDGDNSGYDRQLEDNTTKALINVLDMTTPAAVLQPFLKRFCGINCRNAESVDFALQRTDIHQPRLSTRMALAIAPEATRFGRAHAIFRHADRGVRPRGMAGCRGRGFSQCRRRNPRPMSGTG